MVWGMAQDREGAIWAATSSGMARLEGDRWNEVGKDWNFPGELARAIFLDRQGTLWVSTEDALVFLPPGTTRFQSTGIKVGQVMQIAQAASGKLWMAETTRSVRPLPLSDKGPPPDDTEVQVGSQGILFDNDGALWITSVGDGLRRSPTPELLKGRIKEFSTEVESFTAKDGLSDDVALAILQDREGNIWVGTRNGLDRFRKTNMVPIVLPFNPITAVLAAGDAGDLWVEGEKFVTRIQGKHAQGGQLFPPPKYAAQFAYRDPVGSIWWLRPDAIHRYYAGGYTSLALPPSFPKPYFEVAIVATQDGSGTLWLGAQREGLFYLQRGVWKRLETGSEFAKLSPRAAFTDWMGRAWIGYDEGTIILLADENIQKVFLPGDSPVGSVRAIGGRGNHTWVGGELGLAFFDGNRLRRIVPADAETFESVMGVQEVSGGGLWLAESRGVIEIPATEVQQALENPSYRVRYRLLDSFDGLPGRFVSQGSNSKEAQATDGVLWFAASGGIAWVDPANISTNPLPPPVLIRSVKTNGRQLDSLANLVLPARTTDLQISYTALSLSVPERVRFRYKLEGVDKDWQDAGARREAFYTRLGPGQYHFQVIASNNDGVWNYEGAHLDFGIAPSWYQTNWFRIACVGAFLILMWGLYQLRLRQLRRHFSVRLEARVNERTRIARELHDTLLQGLHGLMFEFQAARNMFQKRPEEALHALDDAIMGTEHAISESQDAIENLRGTSTEGDLVRLIKIMGEDLAAARCGDHDSPRFGLTVEGQQRALSPNIRDEIYRIAREVLRNAFRHSQAHRIEAEILFDEEQLRLRVRDDGKGMDPQVLEKGGRPGHWGLPGVRERAQQIGAKLDFWSETGAGTEVQLAVPASVAYRKSSRRSRFRMFPKDWKS
jgi:signal transduction histidine kinase/ligand-binding sensor domain-containing protein